MNEKRWAGLILGAGIAAWFAVVAATPRPLPGEIMDDGEYLVAARSLADGRGYYLPSRPGCPPETKYPPGTSLLAVPFLWAWPGTDAQAGRAAVAVAGAGFALFAALALAAAGVRPFRAAVASVAGLLTWPALEVAGSLMSDVPFAAAAAAAMWHWYAAEWAAGPGRRRWHAVLAGGLAAGALLVRVAGAPLALGLLAGGLAGGRPSRAAWFVLGLALVLGPARLWLAARPPAAVPEVYTSDLAYYRGMDPAGATRDVAARAARYAGAVARLVVPVLETNAAKRAPLVAGAGAGAAFALFGVALTANRRSFLARRHVPAALWLAGTVALVAVWPWDLGGRPFIAFGPLLVCGLVSGAARVASSTLGLRAAPVWATAFAAYLALAGFRALALAAGSRLDPATAACLDHIRTRTTEDAVVITYVPEAVYLATGRQGFKSMPDRHVPTRTFGDWGPIDEQAAACAGRPLYLWGQCPVGERPDDQSLNLERLRESRADRLRVVFTAPGGTQWVARIDPPR